MTTVSNTDITTIIIKKWMHIFTWFLNVYVLLKIGIQMYVQFYLIFT